MNLLNIKRAVIAPGVFRRYSRRGNELTEVQVRILFSIHYMEIRRIPRTQSRLGRFLKKHSNAVHIYELKKHLDYLLGQKLIENNNGFKITSTGLVTLQAVERLFRIYRPDKKLKL